MSAKTTPKQQGDMSAQKKQWAAALQEGYEFLKSLDKEDEQYTKAHPPKTPFPKGGQSPRTAHIRNLASAFDSVKEEGRVKQEGPGDNVRSYWTNQGMPGIKKEPAASASGSTQAGPASRLRGGAVPPPSPASTSGSTQPSPAGYTAANTDGTQGVGIPSSTNTSAPAPAPVPPGSGWSPEKVAGTGAAGAVLAGALTVGLMHLLSKSKKQEEPEEGPRKPRRKYQQKAYKKGGVVKKPRKTSAVRKAARKVVRNR